MAKRVKKNASNSKKNRKNIGAKSNLQKRKITEEPQKPTIVKDKNLKFKNKDKKIKVAKKIKQTEKNNVNKLLNSAIVKIVDIKNKGKSKKVEQQVQNKKRQGLKDNKQKQGENHKKSKVSKTNSKIDCSEKPEERKSNRIRNKMEQQANDKIAKLNSLLGKKLKQKGKKSSSKKTENTQVITKQHKLDVKHLEKLLADKEKEGKKKKITDTQPLRQRMLNKLSASRFRYLNETLYKNESSESKMYFKNDPDAFEAYHEGYKKQVEQWPLNPLNIIISSIKKMPKDYIIADFGCGEAKLASSVPHKVHSFDFVSLNKNVTVCDVAHTPLLTSGVHVVVFCLSLMGNNLKDYIIEANRVLKKDGILKIAEVESRFEKVEDFVKTMTSYGFKCTWKDLSHNLFYFLDFKKEKNISGKKNKLPTITLKPCLYKKR